MKRDTTELKACSNEQKYYAAMLVCVCTRFYDYYNAHHNNHHHHHYHHHYTAFNRWSASRSHAHLVAQKSARFEFFIQLSSLVVYQNYMCFNGALTHHQ